jgi:TolA-binding protein
MTTENLILEKHLKKTTLIANFGSLIIGVTTALSVGYAFYYNTTDTLNAHTTQIQEVQSDVKELKVSINNNAVFQAAIKEQMKAMQDEMSSMKHSQERMEDKIDRLISRQ